MGRVDEAMQRAARAREAGVEGAGAEVEPFGSAGVAEEPPAAEFPAEGGPGPRLRPVLGHPAPQPHRVDRGSDAPVLDLAERMAPDLSRKVVIDRETDPISKEQYRRLAASLHAAQASNNLKVITLGSAVASEGKSLTAANLAMTLSESYHKQVLLIDGDLRRPSQHAIFGVDASPGLTDGLDGRVALHRLSAHLTLLTAGQPTNDPMAVLTSARMARLVEEARQNFDWVIIDTPPVGLITDANLLAEASDGTLLVVRAESTPAEIVQRAIASIGRERVLGVVLNRARETPESRYHYYGYYQAPPGESLVGD